MKNLARYFVIFVVFMLSVAFIGCSNGSSSNDDNSSSTNESSTTSVPGSSYRGAMTSSSRNETVYIEFRFADSTNWTSQGYTENFAATSETGTTSGTYTISGTTITINMPMFNTTLTGSTSDDWATIVCSGDQLFTGTLTKQ